MTSAALSSGDPSTDDGCRAHVGWTVGRMSGEAGRNMDSGSRDELLSRLAEAIASVEVSHPTRVAVDGPPAAGKTTLADELAVVLRALGRDVIRATIDDFLFPKAQRYRRGEYSAESCYLDTHDHGTLNRVLLDPLGPDG